MSERSKKSEAPIRVGLRARRLLQEGEFHAPGEWLPLVPTGIKLIPGGKYFYEKKFRNEQFCRGRHKQEIFIQSLRTPHGWTRPLFEERARELLKADLDHESRLLPMQLAIGFVGSAVWLTIVGATNSYVGSRGGKTSLAIAVGLFVVIQLVLNAALEFLPPGAIKFVFWVMCGLTALGTMSAFVLVTSDQWVAGLSVGSATWLAFYFFSTILTAAIRHMDASWTVRNLSALTLGRLQSIYHTLTLHAEEWPSYDHRKYVQDCMWSVTSAIRGFLPGHLGDRNSRVFSKLAVELSEQMDQLNETLASGQGRKRMQDLCKAGGSRMVVGHWQEMLTQLNDPVVLETRKKRSGFSIARLLAVALAPTVAALIMAHFSLLAHDQSKAFFAFAVIWAMVVFIYILDSDPTKYLTFFKDLMTAFKGLKSNSTDVEN